jgi:hypothetical protein
MDHEMSTDSKKAQNHLERIKKQIRESHDYFKPNYDRFNEFRRFVFESSLTNDEISLLATLSKPQLEFNILEAYISRLLGEFSKQEPDIVVTADNENQVDPATIKLVEQHLRHVFFDSDNHHTRYEIYKDLLSGGFSVLKVLTDYANEMSFNQEIQINRAYDPTLCGFDQLARFSHKGDGRFCFELFPMAKDEFKEKFPEIPTEKLNFRRDFAGFNWSYLNDSTPIILIADYYEKKKKRVSIVQLRDGRVMRESEYNRMRDMWFDTTQPPVVIGKPRTTEIDTIIRYRVIETQVIEEVETDFKHFPLIFVDGSSVLVKTPKNGNIRQVCRPYVYHAKGAQRLKNYAGIAMANEIENIVQHKFIIKKEALPKEEDYLSAIKDIQKPSNIVVNAYYEENPNQPIPEPIREIAKVPAPPEILQAFQGTDSLIQQVLGSYDASLGINDNQLSGIAVVEAATQSNAAAMPYIVGFLHGMQRAAEIYVDLIPKYWTTPRTMPVIDEEGHRGSVKVNQEGGFKVEYETNALNVRLKAGANFQVQKSKALQQIALLQQMSPQMQEFMAERGLPFILSNVEMKDIELLKEATNEWMEEKKQQRQMAIQAQQQQAMNDPRMMMVQAKMQEIQTKRESDKETNAIKHADAQLRHSATIHKTNAEIIKSDTELQIKREELAHKKHVEMRNSAHQHAKDIATHHHAITQTEKAENE